MIDAEECARALKQEPGQLPLVAARVMQGELVTGDALGITNIGIFLREANLLEAAEKVLRMAVAQSPPSPFAYHDLSICLSRQFRWGDSAVAANRAHNLSSENWPITENWIISLAFAGLHSEAERALERYFPRPRGPAYERLREFISFIKNYGATEVITRQQLLEDGQNYLGAREMSCLLSEAVRGDAPFSFLRLGDGEGAWLSAPAELENAYPTLFASNRKEFLIDWFGSERLGASSEFRELGAMIARAVQDADLLGVPDSGRLAHEYSSKSVRGIPSCVRVLETLRSTESSDKRSALRTKALCSANGHFELDGTEFFKNLFSVGKDVCIVTSYQSVPGYLESSFAGRVARVHFVPGDTRNPSLGGDGIEAIYPERFRKLEQEIAALDVRSSIYLVSAGYVGKALIGQIKAQGGIALDIGAITNAWHERSQS